MAQDPSMTTGLILPGEHWVLGVHLAGASHPRKRFQVMNEAVNSLSHIQSTFYADAI